MTGNDTLRDFYGRIVTLVTELRTTFYVVISEDQTKRALFRELPNAANNTFLLLKVTPSNSTGSLHDLCFEVIQRH